MAFALVNAVYCEGANGVVAEATSSCGAFPAARYDLALALFDNPVRTQHCANPLDAMR